MMQENNTPGDTMLQFPINTVLGQFEGDKEKMHDLLDNFFFEWANQSHQNGIAPQKLANGIMLYHFFDKVIRTMKISAEQEN